MGLFLETSWGLLTVEVVPQDQQSVPIPEPGETVQVYGTWVRDQGHYLGIFSWNELHPGVFLHSLSSGVEGGTVQCKLLAGVHDPERLKVLDPTQPCRWALGKVRFVFQFSDGDWHIDLRLDPTYQYLANGQPPLVEVSYPAAVTLVSAVLLGFGIPYLGVSIEKPRQTFLGRLARRLGGRK